MKNWLKRLIETEEELLNLKDNPSASKEVNNRDMLAQRECYRQIWIFGRQRVRQELRQIHQDLMTDPGHIAFRDHIQSFFSSPMK